jgi:predicted metal-dependent hydrolase
MSEPRYAPTIELPPYSYVPGHDLPHPVNDPAGHLFAARDSAHEPPISATVLADLPTTLHSRRRALAAALAANSRWLYALDLYNAGFYWEAHEVWEGFWNALGRTTPEAQFVQGLIHLAAAAVKIREGKPVGVARHRKRARDLLGDLGAADIGGTLGLAPESISAVVTEFEHFTPACWHTSRTPVVRVLAERLRLVR